MITVIINVPLPPNQDLLVQQLQADASYQTLTTGPGSDPQNPISVTVYLSDNAPQTDQDQAVAIVKEHNPAMMTADQQAAQQAQQQVDSIPAEVANVSATLKGANAQSFADVNALLQKIAPALDAINLILKLQSGA